MIRLLPGLLSLVIVGLLAGPVAAEVQQKRHAVQMTPGVASKVPQTQKTTVQKREAAKQQRDRKLKIRAANAQAKGGPTSLQKPAKP